MAKQTNIGIYARLSIDRNGEKESTKRQIESAKAYAKAKGWKVGNVYEDKNLSAWNPKVKRPAYESMLDDLRTGAIEGVVVWKLDRLVRRIKEWERFWDVCQEAGGIFASVNESFDTSTPLGRGMIKIMAVLAEIASAETSLRVTTAHTANAMKGGWNGGGKRPFGLTKDRKHIVPAEAKLIREAAKRIIKGGTFYSISKDWNARGFKTTLGGAWRPSSVRNCIRGLWVTGRREVNGEIIKAAWPAILNVETWEKITTILNDPDRMTHSGGKTELVWSLIGVIKCECGAKMYSKSHAAGKRYTCTHGPGDNNCGSCGISAGPVDELVRDAVLQALDSDQFRRFVRGSRQSATDRKLLKQLQDDKTSLEMLAHDFYVDRRIGRQEFFKTKETLERQIEAAEKQVAKLSQRDVKVGLVGKGEELRKRWDRESPMWRRELIRAVIDNVTIKRTGRGYPSGARIGQRYGPEHFARRVEINWKF